MIFFTLKGEVTMVSKEIIDRRKGIRAKRIITIRHRLAKRGGKKVKRDWSLSVTENMSISGLLFLSPEEYKKGDVLELQVVMSGVLDIFNGFAEVVRIDKKRSKEYVAVKYVEVKQKKRSAKRLNVVG